MFNSGTIEPHPVFWPLAELRRAYESGRLSPVEVLNDVIARIEKLDPIFNTYLAKCYDLALEQARHAEAAYGSGNAGPLSGIPVSIKDTFHIKDCPITYGSLIHKDDRSSRDSGAVRRLRAAGAVFPGKTNAPEFGQSATTDNRLRDHCRNPWDVHRTAGGSSGGAASSVAAGLASVAIGADGGGSIRIPAAFNGLFGIKPTIGLCKDEGGFRAMTDFVCPGPLSRTVADARTVLSVMSDRTFERKPAGERLRIAWCAAPEGLPVDPGVAGVVGEAVGKLSELGHDVVEARPPIEGWNDIFAPLVLNDEKQERLGLLESHADLLTEYELKTLRAAAALSDGEVENARQLHGAFRTRMEEFFTDFDLLVSPATATTAFPLDRRPAEIDGRKVDRLWGAFPFTPPYNVAGCPAASLPCGFVDGLPVGVQIVGNYDREEILLDVSEELEEALSLDNSPLLEKWGVVV